MQPDAVFPLDGLSSVNADAPLPLHIVIAYDDVPAGRRALATLSRMLKQERAAVHLFPALWRFDHLQLPEWRERALADAVAADLLILSTSVSQPIDGGVDRWLSALLSRRRDTDTAILALFGPDEEWSISVHDASAEGNLPVLVKPCGRKANIRPDAADGKR